MPFHGTLTKAGAAKPSTGWNLFTRNNPKVQAQLEELVVQVGEQVFYDPMPDMVGDTYRINITLRMDDKQLLSVCGSIRQFMV
jgi:hypothetical protein